MHTLGKLGAAPFTNPSSSMKEKTMLNKDAFVNAAIGKITANKENQVTHNLNVLKATLLFGEQSSLLKRTIPSTKLRGTELAKRFPESQNIDPALRSNSLWLYEALNAKGLPENDILEVLGLQRIEDICVQTGNPTVIKRMYRKAKANAQTHPA